MLATPEMVSIETGNQTASAMRKTAESPCNRLGVRIIASGTQAVAGIGPTTFSKGIPQYRAGPNQPIVTPKMSPKSTPTP